ncbi:response regulator [Pedobacter sp. ISL-68]|uniref:LytR/AlgR family response regulator transcription factor n=1 Tax=unclassified Pedobacter TaxID=2628915 RepID=UPI001BE8B0C7|nr:MULTISPECIES: response regulator [unclassified Pedobacter]MBT2560786.1 response regulator [Pedobacter sp. ISL-64]MBT2590165.1 response regulator [Pedobacter sp. ISL-68]
MNFPLSQSYSCVIIDDSQMSIKTLENFVSKIDKLQLKGSFTNAIDAMAAFWKYGKIDFLFLDVQMEISGIDMARMLRNSVKFVVFISADDNKAIDAFDKGNCFLFKPLDFVKFEETVNQLILTERENKEILF